MSEQAFLPFMKPSISEEAIAEVVECLRSGWLATGPRVQAFEEQLKQYLASRHALALTSGTAGLHLALLAIKFRPGDEVITTPLTFAATFNTIILAGAKPVCVDIDPTTLNMDMTHLADAITSHTRAIVPVHYAGLPVDLDPLYEIADDFNLRVIEDAAHAIGAEYKGKKIGSFGDTQVFSFHPNKNMTTGEGGCVTTRDDDLAYQVKVLRFHGIDRDVWNRFSKKGDQNYSIVAPGLKYNMMDLQAALGIHQLRELDAFIEARTQRANIYLRELKDIPEITLPSQPAYAHRHAWHLFTVLINPEIAGMTRDEFMAEMKELGIGTGLHYNATHLYSYYRETFGFKQGDFPKAESVGSRIVSLPLFPSMTDAEQSRVIDSIKTVFKRKIS